MSRTLPPLLALRAFEAAARLLSFTLAGAELHVSQSAISRQVRLLEEYLQRPLFLRMTRKIALTVEGEAYFQAMHQVFEKIEEASAMVSGKRIRTSLSIAVLPSISSLWLMPRLSSFWQANQHIDLKIISSIEAVDFKSQQIDMAIKVGALPGQRYDASHPRIEGEMLTQWRNVRADALFPDVLVPVCCRTLLQKKPLKRLADLRHHCLIHTAIRRHAWSDWLSAYGARIDPHKNALDCGHYFMSLQAAREGLGIALVPAVLVDSFDPQGTLLRPFPATLPSAGRYYLLTPQQRYEERPIKRFREWLLAQAAT